MNQKYASRFVRVQHWNPVTKELTFETVGIRHETLPKVKLAREMFDAETRDSLNYILRNSPVGGDLRNKKGITVLSP